MLIEEWKYLLGRVNVSTKTMNLFIKFLLCASTFLGQRYSRREKMVNFRLFGVYDLVGETDNNQMIAQINLNYCKFSAGE